MRRLDLVGQQFGRLTVVALAEIKDRHTFFLCQCSCGTKRVVLGTNLQSGHTQSCGCLNKDSIRDQGNKWRASPAFARRTVYQKHGKYKTTTYRSWIAMKGRCLNPRSHAYSQYGGRGITVCERWLVFENFLADMGERPKGLSIERRDNDKGYHKKNCYWGTRKQQMRNRSCTLRVDWEGQLVPLSELCEQLGINYRTAYARLADGKTLEEVLSKKKGCFFRDNNPRQRYLTYKGQTKRMRDWAEEFGIKVPTLSNRIKLGWSMEKALNTRVSYSASERKR